MNEYTYADVPLQGESRIADAAVGAGLIDAVTVDTRRVDAFVNIYDRNSVQ